MPEQILDELCVGGSLRDIITYLPCACPCPCVKPPKRKKRSHRGKKHKCGKIDKSCPQRIEEIARPMIRRVQNTLERYSDNFDTERVDKICRLIHELEHPQPKPDKFWKKPLAKRRRKRRQCRNAKLCARWLTKQSQMSADLCIKYLQRIRKAVPNYKQLQVSMKIFRKLNFCKVYCLNKYVKGELQELCQKLAILMDIKLAPYKQDLLMETVSASTLEDKHCVFRMFDMEYESETEIEEEEEESIVSSIFGLRSITEFAEEEEEKQFLGLESFEEQREIKGEEEEASAMSEGELDLLMREIEGEAESEGEQLALAKSLSTRSKEIEEGVIGPSEAESIFGEGALGEEVGVITVKELEEKSAAFEEEESVMEGPSEEEEGLPDTHPEGTSSYIDWCLYVSWLKELGNNIEMYANCLQKFKCALMSDNPSKYQDSLRFLLKNWTNYLSESRRVDNNMTQYFKDKPMTWCNSCRDCSIDDYPTSHYIPPQLDQVIKTTKQWRRLLAEAEEYCRAICPSGKEGEEEGAEESEEVYEIYDVGSSSSSSYDIEQLGVAADADNLKAKTTKKPSEKKSK